MEKLSVIFLIALVVVHATARDIPNDNTKPSNALAPVEKTETVVKNVDAPAVNGVGDEKNFITYGGMGGWAGVGYIGGVIPVMPVLGGGIPGASGLGGTGGLGGLGGAGGGTGLGGLGGVGAAGGAGGAAGKVIP